MAEYNFDKLIEQINKIDADINKTVSSFKLADKTVKELGSDKSKGIKELTAQIKELGEANKKLTSAEKEQLKVNKQKLKDLQKLDEETQREIALKRDAETAVRKKVKAEIQANKEAKELIALNKKQYKSEAELIRQTNLLVKKRKNMVVVTKKERQEYRNLTSQIERNNSVLKNSDKSIGRYQRNVGNYMGGIKKLLGFAGIAGGFMLLKKVISGVLSSTQILGDKWARTTKGMSFAYDNFLRTVATGDWSNFFDNMQKAYEAGKKYADMLDELFEKGNAVAISQAKTNSIVAEQEVIAKDITKSNGERLDAANKIYNAENEQLAKNKQLKQDTYDAQVFQLTSITGLTEEQFKTFAEGYNEDAELRKKAINLIGLQKDALEEIVTYTDVKTGIQTWGPNKPAIKRLEDYTEELGKGAKAVQYYADIYKKYGKSKDEVVKSAVDAYISLIDVETTYNRGLRRNELNRQKILDDIKKDKMRRAKEARAARDKQLAQDLADFKERQKLELTYYKLQVNDEKRLTEFKKQQKIELLQFQLTYGKKLNNVQKQIIKNEIKLSEKDKPEIVNSFIPNAKDTGVPDLIDENVTSLFNTANQQAEKQAKKLQKKGKFNFLKAIFGGGENAQQAQQAILDIFHSTFDMINTLYDANIQKIEDKLALQDDEIAKTQELLDAELNSIEEQKKAGQAYDLSRKKALENQLKNEQSARNKTLQAQKEMHLKQQRLQISQAVIDLASGIMSIWSGKNIAPYWLKLLESAALAATGAVQIANIKTQHFAEGTEYAQLNGNPPGTDTIPAMINEGEGIIPTKINKGIPYNKGFKHWMIPAAAEMFLNGNYYNDNSETNKYLKNIDKNTQNNIIRNSEGRVVFEKKGNHFINYN